MSNFPLAIKPTWGLWLTEPRGASDITLGDIEASVAYFHKTISSNLDVILKTSPSTCSSQKVPKPKFPLAGCKNKPKKPDFQWIANSAPLFPLDTIQRMNEQVTRTSHHTTIFFDGPDQPDDAYRVLLHG